MPTKVDTEEREAQEALGLSRTYSIDVEIPLKGTGSTTFEIKAVSNEDAIARAQELLDMLTDQQLITDCEVERGGGPYPSSGRSRGFHHVKIAGDRKGIKIVVRQNAEADFYRPGGDPVGQAEGAG